MSLLPQDALRHRSRVLANLELAPGTHELELARGGFLFRAGDEIVIHGRTQPEDRTYSLVSGEEDRSLKLLIRVIPDGVTSPRLAAHAPGDTVEFTGPTGSFHLRAPDRPFWFIASGTGIAPLISFLRTNSTLRPTVLHGVRTTAELYYRAELESRAALYCPCVTREGAQRQRVTDALKTMTPPPEADFYLCGGQPMIHDIRAILLAKDVPPDRIFTEPYFFW